MDGLPAVSCMCLTFGRPRLLEEAIQSFLQQDYAGPKELVVLNDCPQQQLDFDHPDVHVVNVSRRFRTVGEKRNACAALTSHDLLFVWDDDDICLPHRLTYSVRMLDERKEFFKASRAFVLNDGRLKGPEANSFHAAGCFTKQLFDAAHGYAHMGSGQDLDLEIAIEKIIGRGKDYDDIRPDEVYYLYRWGGTNSYHLSGFGRDQEGAESGNQKVQKYVEQQIAQKRIPTGKIKLRPTWRTDYSALIRGYLQAMSQTAS